MSYSIHVVDSGSGETVKMPNTYLGWNPEAETGITYNYAEWFYKLWPEPKGKKEKDDVTPFGQMFGKNDGGIRSLYGKPVKDVIEELDKAVKSLDGGPDEDYWKSTEGNAKTALLRLKHMCELAELANPGSKLVLQGD